MCKTEGIVKTAFGLGDRSHSGVVIGALGRSTQNFTPEKNFFFLL